MFTVAFISRTESAQWGHGTIRVGGWVAEEYPRAVIRPHPTFHATCTGSSALNVTQVFYRSSSYVRLPAVKKLTDDPGQESFCFVAHRYPNITARPYTDWAPIHA